VESPYTGHHATREKQGCDPLRLDPRGVDTAATRISDLDNFAPSARRVGLP
jgi:hypothetical protein